MGRVARSVLAGTGGSCRMLCGVSKGWGEGGGGGEGGTDLLRRFARSSGVAVVFVLNSLQAFAQRSRSEQRRGSRAI